MELSEIASVWLEEEGVIFKYLLIDLEKAGESKAIVRGLNHTPYAGNIEEEIVNSTEEELKEGNFFENGGNLQIKGGGSITINSYNGTIALYGASQTYGAEKNREAVASMIEDAYPEHEVSWFVPEPDSESSES
ncbi:hypothetical protein MYX82_13705 [Acidobacteria bacterium AH-259-D05]|nr:hypothetical protein [Acidobacteria bacterium AH-259-D05]